MSYASQIDAINLSLESKRASITVEWQRFAATHRQQTPAQSVLDFMDRRNAQLQADAAFLSGVVEGISDETFEARPDLEHLDRARREVLQRVELALRAAVARGEAWPKSLPAADSVLYAIVRSYNGRSEYAALAEKETGAFLASLASLQGMRDFFDITAFSRKAVTQPGPDGIFLGAASLFGLGKDFLGLEVKTIVSDSFTNVMKTLYARYDGGKNPDFFRLDTQTRGKGRIEALIKSKTLMPVDRNRADAAYQQLSKAAPARIGTMLVIRNVGFAPLRIPEWAYQAFDLVLIFDVWGMIDWETSRRQRQQIRNVSQKVGEHNRVWLFQRAQKYLKAIGMDMTLVRP